MMEKKSKELLRNYCTDPKELLCQTMRELHMLFLNSIIF